jgi:predicted alpha/beta-hydrolase family hydrolase
VSAAPATFEIDVRGVKTSAITYAAPDAKAVLVLAPGAGAPQRHPWLVAMVHSIVERGIAVITFDFLYAHAKRRTPDRSDVLEATWQAVMSAVRARTETQGRRLFAGGKSMGGRIATQVAARGELGEIGGLILLGYPLHPPGRPDRLRAAHLPEVAVPTLFVQGSRDAFGTPVELAPFVEAMPAGGRLFVVDGGDHSLTPPKRGPESLPVVMARVADEIARFCCCPPEITVEGADAVSGRRERGRRRDRRS